MQRRLLDDLFKSSCGRWAGDISYDDASVRKHPRAALEAIEYALLNLDALMRSFTPERIAKGFQAIYSASESNLPFLFLNADVDVAVRARVIALTDRLYGDFFRHVCAATVEEIGMADDSCGYLCYMLWDLCPVYPGNAEPEIIDAAAGSMDRVLTMTNESCVVGALHGLGHWIMDRPDLARLVRERRSARWSEAVLRYSHAAESGYVQ